MADSDKIKVQRRRMVKEGGVLNGRGSGMAQDWGVLVWSSRDRVDVTDEV